MNTGNLSPWINGMICAAVFCSIALALTPEGRVKNAEKLLCGIVMLAAIFSPLFGFHSEKYASEAARYAEIGKELAGEGSDSVERLNRTLIEQELCAYILDKAESVGVHTVSAEVEVAWDDAGYWYPVGASISCDATNEQREKLGALIEAELGIPADRQEWSEVKNG